jgi:Flp pilus assembly protein TadD
LHRLEPGELDNRLDLAVVQLSQGEARSALGHLRKIAAARPHDARAHFYFAVALRETGAAEQAASMLAALAAAGGDYAARARELLGGRGYLSRCMNFYL